MLIRKFQETDVHAAGQMAYDTWSYELNGVGHDLNRFIHEYMVRYYDTNRQYSFSLVDQSLNAFLLAGFKTDQAGCNKWFENTLSRFLPEEKEVALEYRDYLSRNGSAVKKYMKDGDIMMNLFMSKGGGTGRRLLTSFEALCRKNAVENIFLWADVTCNYSYYEKNGFEILERFGNRTPVDIGCLDTYIFKKRLN
ncbi:hypothetical protein [uncultured Oxalobacter sp.]|uniref:GNAT family N-acetyltransferase n=1 Tax=uncultured Oxalobacter sp. TaxID=337245 RepID=UPI002591B9CB|nr:hypothetical protein [uncultured Oxalobacter sp.]